MRRGMSLVELLVVVGIIGVLLALALPAVQMARESARRSQCQSNLRQLGLALQHYHESHGCLPLGRVTTEPTSQILPTSGPGAGCPETGIFLTLLPYVEQQPLADAFNYTLGFYGRATGQPPYLMSGMNANSTVMVQWVNLYQCPSDRRRVFTVSSAWPRAAPGIWSSIPFARGNYAGCWGNTNWGQTADFDGDGRDDVVQLKSAFGHVKVSFGEFGDGLANTMVLSETLQGSGSDLRGFLPTALPGAAMFNTRLGPNGERDGYGFVTLPGDAQTGNMWCHPERMMPCHDNHDERTSFAGARSWHSGGVHVALGDGSATFVTDGIDFRVWVAYGSIAAGDVSQ